jgi:hypothetical protein
MIFIGKVILLTIILMICYSIAFLVSGISNLPAGSEASPDSATDIMTALLLNAFFQVSVISYIILRSRWRSWKLIGTLFCCLLWFAYSYCANRISYILTKSIAIRYGFQTFHYGSNYSSYVYTPCSSNSG